MSRDELRRRVVKIQAQAQKATLGPWTLEIGESDVLVRSPLERTKKGEIEIVLYEEFSPETNVDDFHQGIADFAFCAASRTNVPWLCEQLLKLLEEEK